jgi:hypothetical protein
LDKYSSHKLFVSFPTDGTISACVHDAPGSLHDSTVANFGGHYILLIDVYDHNRGVVVMDSVLARVDFDFILKS